MAFVVTGGGRLEDRIDAAAPGRCARRIADAGGDRLETLIRRGTPVDLSPTRNHTRPHLRDTIERTRVEEWPGPLGTEFRVRVATNDPIAPDVEWNTRPHDIPNAFGYGDDFGIGGRFEGRFHPGTTGHHMFALGAAKTEAELHDVAAGPLRELERELIR